MAGAKDSWPLARPFPTLYSLMGIPHTCLFHSDQNITPCDNRAIDAISRGHWEGSRWS